MRQEGTVQATRFEVLAGHQIGCELCSPSTSPRSHAPSITALQAAINRFIADANARHKPIRLNQIRRRHPRRPQIGRQTLKAVHLA
jgi:hypothetical protein